MASEFRTNVRRGGDRSLEAKIEERLDSVWDEVTSQLQSQCAAAVAPLLEQTRLESRTAAIESLAAAGRRIRSENSVGGVARALVDSTAHYCGRVALFISKEDHLAGFQLKSTADDGDLAANFNRLKISPSEGEALAHAVSKRDAIVASGRSSDISERLSKIFRLRDTDRVFLFPIVLRNKVLAVLYADAAGESEMIEPGAIELLTSIAETWIEIVGTRGRGG